MYQPPYPSGSINPAVLAAFQQQQSHKQPRIPGPGLSSPAINPAQLMNGPIQSPAAGGGPGINPTQLLQQHGMLGPSTPAPSSNPINFQALAAMFGMSPAQFNALPAHERQQKVMLAASQNQALREQMREKQALQIQMQQMHAAQQVHRDQSHSMGMMNNASNMGNMNNNNNNLAMSASQAQFRDQILQSYNGPPSNNSSSDLSMAMGIQPRHDTMNLGLQPTPRVPSAMGMTMPGYERDRPSSSGGQMLPPSGIPRGMNMNMNLNMNMPSNRTPMRPPSRAMSSTPVNGVSVNGRGMSPTVWPQPQTPVRRGTPTPMQMQAHLQHQQAQHQAQQQQHQAQHQQTQMHPSPVQSQAHALPSTPQQQSQSQASPPPQQQSPYRGAKRKLPGEEGQRDRERPPSRLGVEHSPQMQMQGHQRQPSVPLSVNGVKEEVGTPGAAAQNLQMQMQESPQQQQQRQLSQQPSVPQLQPTPQLQTQTQTQIQSQTPQPEAQPTTQPQPQPQKPGSPTPAPAPASVPAPAPLPIPILPPLPPAHLIPPSTTHITIVPLAASVDPSAPPGHYIRDLDSTELTAVQEWMARDREYERVWGRGRERAGREGREREGMGSVLTGEELKAEEVVVDGVTGQVKEKENHGDGGWWPGGEKPRGYGWGWWEKGYAEAVGGNVSLSLSLARLGGGGMRGRREGFDVRYPRVKRDRERERERRGVGGKVRREGLRLPRKLDVQDVERQEQLVPLRLEFDVEHHKMRDTFVWNLNDPVVTPEHFAQTVVEDYGLPASYHSVITKSIQDQLGDYKTHSGLYDAEDQLIIKAAGGGGIAHDGAGRLGDEEGKWWEEWRGVVERAGKRRGRRDGGKEGGRKQVRPTKKRRKNEGEGEGDADDEEEGEVVDMGEVVKEKENEKVGGTGSTGKNTTNNNNNNGNKRMLVGMEKPKRLEEMEVNEALMHEEMRILIKLDIIVGSMKLDDQFEWDIEDGHVSPEEFAEIYAQELGLNGEFKTAIAHSIREQVQTYQKSLFLVGHPSDGTAIQDDDLRLSFLPSLTSAARPLDQIQHYTPLLNYLSDGEIDRNEKDREKDMTRRRKRNTRGRRGVALPDREPIRTYRTPAIGFPELDPATLALAAAANAPVSRRAAAAAASLTIANMVASENGTAFLPQLAVPSSAVTPMQQQQQVQVQPKKSSSSAKGHFRAPPYPQSVLRARAGVTAPTVSTAADVATLPPPMENDPPVVVVSSSVVIGMSGGVGVGSGVGGGTGGGGTGGGMQDSRAQKVITAKRAKELEREAKEKEFADGQHPNMIDGVWHCSNCGCPDSIAVGRRKGPLGDKSQCGICGKYWHRHRRPRPIEYNPDPDFHSGVKRELEQSKISASVKKKGGAAALRAQSSTLPHTPATSEPQTPSRSNGDISRQSPVPHTNDDDRAISPVSSASSASEPPLAQRHNGNSNSGVKVNGAGSSHRRTASTPPRTAPNTPGGPVSKAEGSGSGLSSSTGGGVNGGGGEKTADEAMVSPSSSPARPIGAPPPWLMGTKAAMMTRYPNDRFDVILRKVNASSSPEWRIKCLDCPGKLYTPGPGETLANYEVHLKNRQHRQRVNDRMNNEADA